MIGALVCIGAGSVWGAFVSVRAIANKEGVVACVIVLIGREKRSLFHQ